MLIIGEENDENVGYDSMVLSVGMGKAFTDMEQLRSRVLKFAKHMQSFNKHMEKFENGMHESKRVWFKEKISTNQDEPPKYPPSKEYNDTQWRDEDELNANIYPNHIVHNPNRHVDSLYSAIEHQISNKDPLSFLSRGESLDRHPMKTGSYNGVYSDDKDESDSFDSDLLAACEGWDCSPKDMMPPPLNGFGRFASNAELSEDKVHFGALQTPHRGENGKPHTSFEMGHSFGFSKYLDLASVQEDETLNYTIHDF